MGRIKKTSLKRPWEEKVRIVAHCYLKGFTVDEIVAKHDIPTQQVVRILAQDEFKKGMKRVEEKVTEETLKDKLPLLKKITGDALSVLSGLIEKLQDDENYRMMMITNVRDLKALGDVATQVNGLLRLEKGQSTENIAIQQNSYQETKVLIDDLRKVDPVFEWPQLPEKLPT